MSNIGNVGDPLTFIAEGPIGSGKTTLLLMAAVLLKRAYPDMGFVFDRPVLEARFNTMLAADGVPQLRYPVIIKIKERDTK